VAERQYIERFGRSPMTISSGRCSGNGTRQEMYRQLTGKEPTPEEIEDTRRELESED
jgi:hypothetical protein